MSAQSEVAVRMPEPEVREVAAFAPNGGTWAVLGAALMAGGAAVTAGLARPGGPIVGVLATLFLVAGFVVLRGLITVSHRRSPRRCSNVNRPVPRW